MKILKIVAICLASFIVTASFATMSIMALINSGNTSVDLSEIYNRLDKLAEQPPANNQPPTINIEVPAPHITIELPKPETQPAPSPINDGFIAVQYVEYSYPLWDDFWHTENWHTEKLEAHGKLTTIYNYDLDAGNFYRWEEERRLIGVPPSRIPLTQDKSLPLPFSKYDVFVYVVDGWKYYMTEVEVVISWLYVRVQNPNCFEVIDEYGYRLINAPSFTIGYFNK